MSKCTDCKVELSSENAYRKGLRLNSRCKSCFNRYCTERWKRRKQTAIEAKGNKCFDCQQTFPYSVYDFHHLDPSSKDMDWHDMRLTSEATLSEELSKCVLLCANCHRIRHHNQRSTI